MSRGEARGLIPDRTRSESRKEGEDTLTRSVDLGRTFSIGRLLGTQGVDGPPGRHLKHRPPLKSPGRRLSAARRGSPERRRVPEAAGSHVLASGYLAAHPCTGVVRFRWRVPLFTPAGASCRQALRHRAHARRRAIDVDPVRAPEPAQLGAGAALFVLAPVQRKELRLRLRLCL